jgi:hypothetical protein
MELYQMAVIAIALVNLAVTIWLLRLLLPVWRYLQKVVFVVDEYDFGRLINQFLNGEKPMSETIHVKASENKEEGYKEIVITRTYKKPLDPREIQENFVRQMAEKLQ